MTKARDPVCGMMVDVEKTRFWGEYQGYKVYFCAENCKKTYERDRK